MLRIFIGVDERQPVAYHVLCSSIQRRSSVPIAFTPILLNQIPIKRRGLTSFTFARYIVPYLCEYKGRALFLDSDILVNCDVSELFNMDFNDSVAIVPFDGDLAFERPSVMLFNCEKCKNLTLEYINDIKTSPQSFEWAESIASLPYEYNHLVGYSPKQGAKVIHYTQGVPGYLECRDCEYSDLWFDELDMVNHHVSWLEIMGGSVHAQPVLSRLKENMSK